VLSFYETPIFAADADRIWTEQERAELFGALAENPELGEVVPGSGGCRKVRWSRPGMGKRSGVRAIYYTELEEGEICMLILYPKSEKATIPGPILKRVREEIEDGRKKIKEYRKSIRR
jgi:hypothetical protein